MKKTIYTIAFIAAFQFISQAQTQDKPKKTEEQQKVNPDGTLAPVESKHAIIQSPEVKKSDLAPEGSRSAITEKGVPASKGSEDKSKKSTKPKNSSSDTPKIGRD